MKMREKVYKIQFIIHILKCIKYSFLTGHKICEKLIKTFIWQKQKKKFNLFLLYARADKKIYIFFF